MQRLKSAGERLQRELEEDNWNPADECWSPGTPLGDLRQPQVRMLPSHERRQLLHCRHAMYQALRHGTLQTGQRISR